MAFGEAEVKCNMFLEYLKQSCCSGPDCPRYKIEKNGLAFTKILSGILIFELAIKNGYYKNALKIMHNLDKRIREENKEGEITEIEIWLEKYKQLKEKLRGKKVAVFSLKIEKFLGSES